MWSRLENSKDTVYSVLHGAWYPYSTREVCLLECSSLKEYFVINLPELVLIWFTWTLTCQLNKLISGKTMSMSVDHYHTNMVPTALLSHISVKENYFTSKI